MSDFRTVADLWGARVAIAAGVGAAIKLTYDQKKKGAWPFKRPSRPNVDSVQLQEIDTSRRALRKELNID